MARDELASKQTVSTSVSRIQPNSSKFWRWLRRRKACRASRRADKREPRFDSSCKLRFHIL